MNTKLTQIHGERAGAVTIYAIESFHTIRRSGQQISILDVWPQPQIKARNENTNTHKTL
jgi:hypothetical protein